MKSRFTLRQRLLLLTGFALVPAVGIMAYNLVTMRSLRLAEVEAYALAASDSVQEELYRATTAATTLMFAVGQAPIRQASRREECRAYVAEIQADLPSINDLAIGDGSGIFCHAGVSQANEVARLAAEILSDMDEDRVAIGTYHETPAGGVLPLILAFPSTEGEESRFVLLNIGLKELQEIVLRRGFAEDGPFTVVDREGTILFHGADSRDYSGEPIHEDYAWLLAGAVPASLAIPGLDGRMRIVGYQPATATVPFSVMFWLPRDRMMAPVDEATLISASIALAGGLAAALLAWIVASSFIRRPVLHLSRVLVSRRTGDRSVRSGIHHGTSEFGTIAASLDDLFDELDRRENAQHAAEEQRDLFHRELQHRIKNLLAIIQVVARQTMRKSDLAEVRDFEARIQAIVRANAVLFRDDQLGGSLRELATEAISPFVASLNDSVTVSGPDLRIVPKAGIALNMALHELATNASKYGALSVSGGHVAVRWQISGEEFRLSWQETGGPTLTAPDRAGFGTMMIRRVLEAETRGSVDLDYAASGLRFELRAPLENVVQQDRETEPARSLC